MGDSVDTNRALEAGMRNLTKVVLSVLVMCFCSVSWGACEKSEVLDTLDSAGYAYEQLPDDGDYNFRIKKSGATIRAWVEPDGDSSFRAYFVNGGLFDNEHMRSLMRTFKYIQAYLDRDEDVAIAYDVKNHGETCPQHLVQNINVFFDLTEDVRGILRKVQSSEHDASETIDLIEEQARESA